MDQSKTDLNYRWTEPDTMRGLTGVDPSPPTYALQSTTAMLDFGTASPHPKGWAMKIDPDYPAMIIDGMLQGTIPDRWQFAAPWNQSLPNDHFAEVRVGRSGHTYDAAVCAWTRGWTSNGGTTWQRLMLLAANNHLSIQRYSGTEADILVKQVDYRPCAGDTLRLESYGGCARALLNDREIIPPHVNETCPFGILAGLGVYGSGPTAAIMSFRCGRIE